MCYTGCHIFSFTFLLLFRGSCWKATGISLPSLWPPVVQEPKGPQAEHGPLFPGSQGSSVQMFEPSEATKRSNSISHMPGFLRSLHCEQKRLRVWVVRFACSPAAGEGRGPGRLRPCTLSQPPVFY